MYDGICTPGVNQGSAPSPVDKQLYVRKSATHSYPGEDAGTDTPPPPASFPFYGHIAARVPSGHSSSNDEATEFPAEVVQVAGMAMVLIVFSALPMNNLVTTFQPLPCVHH